MNNTKVSLGDICKVDWGNTSLTKSAYIDNGKHLAVSAKGEDGRIDHWEHDELTPVISAIGAQCGKLFLPKERFTAIKNTITLTPIKKNKSINPYCPNFLYLLLSSVQLPRRGAGQPFISKGDLEKFEIALPPLEEQRRIAAILDSANSVLELAKEKARHSTTALYKSLLKQELNQIEADWVRLGKVLKIARGGSPRPIQHYLTDDPGGINWVMIGDTKSGEKYITSTAKRIRTEGLTKTRMVQEGDLLLSNSMSFGRPYIMKIKGAIHDGWLVLSDAHEACNSDYLYHVLGSQICYSQFARAAAGATVKNLNTSIVGLVEIPLPPLSKQREIANKLDSVELKLGLKIASLELKAAQLKDSLTNSLIQKFG